MTCTGGVIYPALLLPSYLLFLRLFPSKTLLLLPFLSLLSLSASAINSLGPDRPETTPWGGGLPHKKG